MVSSVENSFQNSSHYLIWFSIGCFVVDQRSGDGYVKGFPIFEMLDAKIASALDKISQNSHFKKKVSLEEQKAQKEDRFLRGRQIAYLTYEYFRVTGANDSVEN